MGIKIFGSISVNALVEPADKAALIREALLAHILKGEDLIEGLIAASRGNRMDEKAEAFYQYGRDHYTRGLPEGQTMYSVIDQDAIQLVLEAIEGEPVILVFAVNGPLLSDDLVRAYLIDTVDYVPSTGASDATKLDAIIPTPFAFLGEDDISLNVSQVQLLSMAIQSWTTAGSIATIDFTFTYRYEYDADPNPDKEWWQYRTRTLSGQFDKDIDVLNETDEYLDVRYNLASDPNGEERTFQYLLGSGVYPTLDPDLDAVVESPYYPIVPIRTDRVSMVSDGSDLYNTTDSMLKKLGMSVLPLVDAVEESPDIDSIEDVFVTFVANIHSQTDSVVKYFFEYWEAIGLANIGGNDKAQYDAWKLLARDNNMPRRTTLRILETGFESRIIYNYIDQSTQVGNIGPIGTVTSVVTILPPYIWSFRFNFEPGSDKFYETFKGNVEESFVTYVKQIDATNTQTIIVHGLITDSLLAGFKNLYRTLDTSLSLDGAVGFLIPVAKDIADQLPSKNARSEFYTETCVLITYAVLYISVKWYETGIFAAILTIVAVVITIISLGSAIAVAEGLLAIIKAVAISLVKSILIGLAFGLLVNLVGGELALVFAVLAAAAGLVGGDALGKIGDIPWADVLMNASTGIVGGIQSVVADDLADLRDETEKFFEDAEERQKELDEAYDMLGTNNLPQGLMLKEIANMHIDEGPEAFYDRSIHVTNPGVLSLTAVSLYVDSALALPELTNTF